MGVPFGSSHAAVDVMWIHNNRTSDLGNEILVVHLVQIMWQSKSVCYPWLPTEYLHMSCHTPFIYKNNVFLFQMVIISFVQMIWKENQKTQFIMFVTLKVIYYPFIAICPFYYAQIKSFLSTQYHSSLIWKQLALLRHL